MERQETEEADEKPVPAWIAFVGLAAIVVNLVFAVLS